MTKLSYKVGDYDFPSTAYKEAKIFAEKRGLLVKPIYTPIDIMPKADPLRIAKLKEARQKREIERIMSAVGV